MGARNRSMVNIYEAKTQLSKLLERVETGESVTIARAGRPVADRVPHRHVELVLGSLAGRIEFDAGAFDDHDVEIQEMFDA